MCYLLCTRVSNICGALETRDEFKSLAETVLTEGVRSRAAVLCLYRRNDDLLRPTGMLPPVRGVGDDEGGVSLISPPPLLPPVYTSADGATLPKQESMLRSTLSKLDDEALIALLIGSVTRDPYCLRRALSVMRLEDMGAEAVAFMEREEEDAEAAMSSGSMPGVEAVHDEEAIGKARRRVSCGVRDAKAREDSGASHHRKI